MMSSKFHEKLTILNDDFVNYLTRMKKIMPHADFSPTVNDYLKHVAELDKMYGEPPDSRPSLFTNLGSTTTSIISLPKPIMSTSIVNSVAPAVTAAAPAFKPAPAFSFGIPSKPAAATADGTENDANQDGDEEPEEPPKPQEVEQAEKDAIFSCKCAVHNFVQGKYEKRGIGYLSIKELDGGKKQFLIREASTLGRLWTNTFINDNLKFEKVDAKKIRVSYPKIGVAAAAADDSEALKKQERTEIEIILLRLGTEEEMADLIKQLEQK